MSSLSSPSSPSLSQQIIFLTEQYWDRWHLDLSIYDADALGSTVGLTGATGSYLNRYSYLPFGEDLTKVETISNPFEYVGQWGVMDEGNSLDFMRSRYYQPEIGRFSSQDPIGLAGGTTNLYQYVKNSPANSIDPLGLEDRTNEILKDRINDILSGLNTILSVLMTKYPWATKALPWTGAVQAGWWLGSYIGSLINSG